MDGSIKYRGVVQIMKDFMREEIKKLCAESYDKGANDFKDILVDAIGDILKNEPSGLGVELLSVIKELKV